MMLNNYSMDELLQVLSEQVKKYTSNESTSVAYDKARQLMNSILYCLEEVDSGMEQDRAVLNIYEKISAGEALKIGRLKKKEKINQAKMLYHEICKSFSPYQNRCYYETIIKGMPVFFERYDVEYDATNHILTLDYPLLYEIKGLSGIDLIYVYLQKVQLEQIFLSKFSSNLVEEMLCGYHENHSELIINICMLALRNAIGCMLLDKSVYELIISDEDRVELKSIGNNLSLIELERLVNITLDKLLIEEFENDSQLSEYLRSNIKAFAFEIKTYSDNNCLEQIFLGRMKTKIPSTVMFEDGVPMDDEALRMLIDKMREIRSMSDKLIFLKEHVKSLSDLKEILNECFFENEYENVFHLLSDEEVKELKKEISIKIELDKILDEWETALLNF